MNIDISSESQPDLCCDIRLGIPLPDASCSYIYSEHFIEHLSAAEGLFHLRDCLRLLAPGGVLRVATLELENLIQHYQTGAWRVQPWLKTFDYEWIQTRAEYLNICFHEWGHLYLYDHEELARRLGEAGFTQLTPVSRLESDHPELRGLETRIESDLIFEAGTLPAI
jgi:predicted SAM-dependent methyltransferase